ncbi:MAG TPA: TPM domain-containing protein, partial [Casimicrobium sp.]|nr:TPM domain-containing protein [Casimicrobium sp.]
MSWFTSLTLRDATHGAVGLVVAALLSATALAQELAPIPPLVSRVTDTAGTLGASAKQSLDAKLQAFEQATGGELALLVVKTAEPETIDQYGIRVGEAWKIGKK